MNMSLLRDNVSVHLIKGTWTIFYVHGILHFLPRRGQYTQNGFHNAAGEVQLSQ